MFTSRICADAAAGQHARTSAHIAGVRHGVVMLSPLSSFKETANAGLGAERQNVVRRGDEINRLSVQETTEPGRAVECRFVLLGRVNKEQRVLAWLQLRGIEPGDILTGRERDGHHL